MAFQVSPGINVSELDLTAGAQQVSVSDAAFAGPFQWGPALDPQGIASEDELVRTFGKPDDTIASFWFAAQSFLAYSSLLHAVRALSTGALNATANAKTIPGAVTSTNSNVVFVGTNTAFVTTGLLVPGQRIKIGNTAYTVNAIVNTSAFSVTSAPAANVTANAVQAYGMLVKNSDHYTVSYQGGVSGYGPWVAKWAGEMGSSLKVSVCPSGAAFLSSNTTGTISLTAGANTVTGVGTAFDTELVVGDSIVVSGTAYPVASIANSVAMTIASAALKSTSATVGTWQRRWEYASLFDGAPGTSQYVSTRGGLNDEMHIVVVDTGGTFTGTAGTVLERFAFLSKATGAKNSNGENNYYADVINRQSQYVWWLDVAGSTTTNWGGIASSTFGADLRPTTSTLVGGQTDNANITDADLELGYDLFKNADVIDVSLIITGPASASLASYIIQNICETRSDAVAFVSPTKASVVNNIGSEVSAITSFRNSLPNSSYAFLDSGWKYAYDKFNDKFRWVPLNGDMAGIAARSDSATDPWYSFAGMTRGNVKNVAKLAWNPTQINRDDLYKIGVNAVVTFPGQGVFLYGDKTLLARPSAFDRINVRRLFIILEKTVARLARTQLFEFNDEFTRSQFRNVVEPYLRDVKSRRGIVDYRVICDDSNNTSEVVEQNRFVGDIYVKPARAINFIQLNFVAVRSGVSFQEVTGAL